MTPEQKRHRSDAARPARRRDDDAKREQGHPILDLQRLAGNRSVVRAIQPAATPTATPAPAPQATPGRLSAILARAMDGDSAKPTGPVISTDQRAEAEADRVADRAVGRLRKPLAGPPVSGGRLHPQLQEAVGKSGSGLSGLDKVSFRTDSASAGAAERIGARAFTQGKQVSVARGELDHPTEGARLAAHEAVHAVRHSTGASQGGRAVVHAKMRGVAAALNNQGGGPTSGKVRKLVGKLTYWDRIVKGVEAYEAMEEKALAGGNPTQKQMMTLTPKLINQLMKIQDDCTAWIAANGGDKQSNMGDQKHQEWQEAVAKKDRAKSRPLDDDPRTKAPRRQAITMLQSRVSAELADLRNGRWTGTLGLSDTQVKGTGKTDEGQKFKVQELHYVTESGEFSGYFKEDKGFNSDPESHERQAGLRQIDPLQGARIVASYRLDRLFNAGVTARAEFAVHNGLMGTVLESAKGDKISDLLAKDSEEARDQTGKKQVDFEDPVLQRSLNKLQLLDVICGQLDRHQGNYRVNTDKKGNVTGVTGIDLDMSFGRDHKHGDELKTESMNYAGLPELIDAEFGETILKITEADIRNTLMGLLPGPEIDATCLRFRSVKEKVAQVKQAGELTHKWDSSSIARTRDYKKRWNAEGAANYMGQVTNSQVSGAWFALREIYMKMSNERVELPRAPFRGLLRAQMLDLPVEMQRGIGRSLFNLISQGEIETRITDGTVDWQKAVDFGIALINETLDQSTLTKAVIACQEAAGTDVDTLGAAAEKVVGPRFKQIYPVVLQRYSKRALNLSGV